MAKRQVFNPNQLPKSFEDSDIKDLTLIGMHAIKGVGNFTMSQLKVEVDPNIIEMTDNEVNDLVNALGEL